MSPETLGLVGGILGSVVGLAGGVFGTWCSIRNTSGPRERRFIVWAAVGFWIFCSAFLVAMFLLPDPYRHFLWLPYGLVLTLSIVAANRRQAHIRNEETAV